MNETREGVSVRAIQLHEPRSFTIGDAHYLLGHTVATDVPNSLAPGFAGPILLVHCETVLSFTLAEVLQDWSTRDDVYSRDLASHIIIVGNSFDRLTGIDLAKSSLWELSSSQARPSEGPYWIQNGKLTHILRLYTDIQEAFILATQPQLHAHAPFVPLRHSDDQERRMIAVPSRIPSLRLDGPPLSGLRLSVKDNIDLKGVRTCLACRAWQKHYPPAQETSPFIVNLIELGAIVVGKTKLSQFGILEYPTTEWIDVHCPFNPRGDGYLSPGGSSSGGAAALAAHEWLDASIGTDTAGSIRKPAAHNGLFAFRPTTPRVPIKGIFPLASNLDAPGVLARNIDTLVKIVRATMPVTDQPLEFSPKHIHVIGSRSDTLEDDLDEEVEMKRVAEDLTIDLIRDLLHYTQAESSFADLQAMFHDDHLPADNQDVRDIALQALMEGRLPFKDVIREIIDENAVETIKNYEIAQRIKAFKKEHREAHGESPAINPVIRDVLRRGHKIRRAKYDKALMLMKEFQEWFVNRMDGSIAIFQLSEPKPDYRDQYVEDPATQDRTSRIPNSFIAPLAGCPEVVVPIGQIPYHSRITRNDEYMPFAISIIGPPGSDLALLEFVKDFLEANQRPTFLKTGKVAFDEEEPTIQRASSWEPWNLRELFIFKEGEHESGPVIRVVDNDSSSETVHVTLAIEDQSIGTLSDAELAISDEDYAVLTDEASSLDSNSVDGRSI